MHQSGVAGTFLSSSNSLRQAAARCTQFEEETVDASFVPCLADQASGCLLSLGFFFPPANPIVQIILAPNKTLS